MSRIPLAGPAAPAPHAPDDRDVAPSDAERRLEDWLVCHLEDADSADRRDALETLLSASPTLARRAAVATATGPAASRARGGGWEKLRVSRLRGISVVRFPDTRLLREDDLKTVASELSALVRAGHRRVVLNFAGVERMSSQIVGAVASARRRCEAGGGQLRVCGLSAGLEEVFHLTGLAGSLAIFPDERAALEAPWPSRTGPQPLPVGLLTALTRRAGAPARPGGAEGGEEGERSPGVVGVAAPSRLRLVALNGKARGRSVDVGSSPFILGRDPACHLRVDWPAISRRHAALVRRESGWLIRDLGSTNGTLHNGATLRGESRSLAEGDEVRVGPLRFGVALGDDVDPAPVPDEVVASWLREPEPGEAAYELAPDDSTRHDLPVAEHEAIAGFKVDVIEGVLVLTPKLAEVESDSALEALRAGLAAALPPGGPGQVVIDLECVGAMSSRAVGLLMATFLRLDREGTSLRLSRPTPPVQAMLEMTRLPMLVPVFATLDEAVLTTWT